MKNVNKFLKEAERKTIDVQLADAKTEVKRWKNKYNESVKTASDLQKQLSVFANISNCKSRGMIKSSRSKSEGVAAIAPATDWHVEERISHEATNGKNSFNLDEASRRINRFYSKILELIDWQNYLAPVTELWHPLLGDLMSGYIHDELMESNSLSPTEACVFLQDKICSGVDMLIRETKLPIYMPTCVGNHGRTTQKKRIKTSYKNSYEWLLYKTLETRFLGNSRVAFMVGQGYHNTQVIMGRKTRFHHGDGLRYMGGVGGITIPVNKAIAQWNKASPVDFDIFGHWHTFLANYPTWISCGSLMGYSEYSVEIKADFQHPTQAFIVIDRRYGLTQATPIFLTKPNRK